MIDKNKIILFYLINFLLLISFIISVYLTFQHYNSKNLVCFLNSKCDLVLNSKYSKIYNIPISLIGVIYFGIYLILINFFLKKLNKIILIIYSLAGAVVGFLLIMIQFFILKTFCSYCLIVDLSTIFSFLFLSLLYKK
jgi:uncharacterized membrane protein